MHTHSLFLPPAGAPISVRRKAERMQRDIDWMRASAAANAQLGHEHLARMWRDAAEAKAAERADLIAAARARPFFPPVPSETCPLIALMRRHNRAGGAR